MADDISRRIERTDLFNIRFYEKTWFHGSWKGMHYRIEKITDETEKNRLRVTTWPGPYNFDLTDDARKESALFDFSNEGLDDITAYLNTYYQEHTEDFKGILLH